MKQKRKKENRFVFKFHYGELTLHSDLSRLFSSHSLSSSDYKSAIYFKNLHLFFFRSHSLTRFYTYFEIEH